MMQSYYSYYILYSKWNSFKTVIPELHDLNYYVFAFQYMRNP